MDIKKNKIKKRLTFTIILLIILTISCIGLAVAVQNQKIDYQEVEVKVIKAESKVERPLLVRSIRQIKRYVTVSYKSKTYDLKNVSSLAPYSFSSAKAYLYQNELYANIEGIKTSTILAKIYYGVLFLIFPTIIAAIYYAFTYKKAQK